MSAIGTIRIHHEPSRLLHYYLCGLHAGMSIVIMTLDGLSLARILLFGMMLGSAIYCYRCYVVGTSHDITTAILNDKDEWALIDRTKTVITAQLLGSSVCLSWITVLVFKCGDGRHRSLILLSDYSDLEAFRRLRIRLRHSMYTS